MSKLFLKSYLGPLAFFILFISGETQGQASVEILIPKLYLDSASTTDMTWSGSGNQLLANVAGKSLYVLDYNSGGILSKIRVNAPEAELSPNGNWIKTSLHLAGYAGAHKEINKLLFVSTGAKDNFKGEYSKFRFLSENLIYDGTLKRLSYKYRNSTEKIIIQELDFTPGNAPLNHIFLSDDGTQLLASSKDKTAYLWNPTSFYPAVIKFPHDSEVDRGVVSGSYVATVSNRNLLSVFKMETLGKNVKLFSIAGVSDLPIAFTPDLKSVGGVVDHSVTLWDINSGQAIRSFKNPNGYGRPHNFIIDQNRDLLIAPYEGGDVVFFQFSTGAFKNDYTIKLKNGRNNEFRNLSFSEDGRWLIARSAFYKTEGALFDLVNGIWGNVFRDYNELHEHILRRTEDGWYSIFKQDGQALLSFIILFDGEWIVKHSSGLFDASPKILAQLKFRIDGISKSLNLVKPKFFEAGLWKKVMDESILRNPNK